LPLVFPDGILPSAVSRENISVVKRVYEEFNRRNLQAMLEHFSPDAEWEQVAPDPDVYRGLDDIARRLGERPQNFRMEPRRWFPAGADTVVVIGEMYEEEPSRRQSTRDFVHVWKVQAGRAARVFEVAGEPSQD
jgi:ketosteroid isomerase-like protein